MSKVEESQGLYTYKFNLNSFLRKQKKSRKKKLLQIIFKLWYLDKLLYVRKGYKVFWNTFLTT